MHFSLHNKSNPFPFLFNLMPEQSRNSVKSRAHNYSEKQDYIFQIDETRAKNIVKIAFENPFSSKQLCDWSITIKRFLRSDWSIKRYFIHVQFLKTSLIDFRTQF